VKWWEQDPYIDPLALALKMDSYSDKQYESENSHAGRTKSHVWQANPRRTENRAQHTESHIYNLQGQRYKVLRGIKNPRPVNAPEPNEKQKD